MFIPWWNTTTEKARYQIAHQGQVTERIVSQKQYYAEWVSLGTYGFGSDPASNYIRLGDVTGEENLKKMIGFDAVAFAPARAYLPVVLRNYPPEPQKTKTGIHLGSRQDDWLPPGGPHDYLQKIDGGNPGSIWPRAVVVLSDLVYLLDRPETAPCKIAQARVRLSGLQSYLTEAQRQGVTVIIRIHPSPGNFEDWNNPALDHILLTGTDLAGPDYCQEKYKRFRAIDDVATEMNEIYKLNVNQYDWDPTSFFFVPANEPNKEWYSDWDDEEAQVRIRTAVAWQEMDAYFSALYDHVHANYPGVRVLTPPMSQGNYAEIQHPVTCVTKTVGGLSGYDWMYNSFMYKSDGFAWNNYWLAGHETWVDEGRVCPYSHHVYQYFPSWLQTQIMVSSHPAFITEADLFSPCQEAGNTVISKQDQPTQTQQSLSQFIRREYGADYVIAWLLTESPHSVVEQCPSDPENLKNYPEIKWHQAYREDGSERAWFGPWWSSPEQ